MPHDAPVGTKAQVLCRLHRPIHETREANSCWILATCLPAYTSMTKSCMNCPMPCRSLLQPESLSAPSPCDTCIASSLSTLVTMILKAAKASVAERGFEQALLEWSCSGLRQASRGGFNRPALDTSEEGMGVLALHRAAKPQTGAVASVLTNRLQVGHQLRLLLAKPYVVNAWLAEARSPA